MSWAAAAAAATSQGKIDWDEQVGPRLAVLLLLLLLLLLCRDLPACLPTACRLPARLRQPRRAACL